MQPAVCFVGPCQVCVWRCVGIPQVRATHAASPRPRLDQNVLRAFSLADPRSDRNGRDRQRACIGQLPRIDRPSIHPDASRAACVRGTAQDAGYSGGTNPASMNRTVKRDWRIPAIQGWRGSGRKGQQMLGYPPLGSRIQTKRSQKWAGAIARSIASGAW